MHARRFKGVWQIALAAITTAMVLLLADQFVERQRQHTFRVEAENQVREHLLILQARLESQLNGNILLARGLVAVIASNPELTQRDFERAAKPLFDSPHVLRSIAAAPDMVLRLVYPLAGNEKAVGLDYAKSPAQRAAAELARDTNSLVIAGPLGLVQGGKGLVTRIPASPCPLKKARRGPASGGCSPSSLMWITSIGKAGCRTTTCPSRWPCAAKTAKAARARSSWVTPPSLATRA